MAYVLSFDEAKKTTTFKVEIEADGQFAFFTEHMPFEFEDKEHFFKDASGNDVEPIAQELTLTTMHMVTKNTPRMIMMTTARINTPKTIMMTTARINTLRMIMMTTGMVNLTHMYGWIQSTQKRLFMK